MESTQITWGIYLYAMASFDYVSMVSSTLCEGVFHEECYCIKFVCVPVISMGDGSLQQPFCYELSNKHVVSISRP